MNAQGHSRSPAAVSGQVAYRCAVYSLIILYVKREAVIVLMKLSVGILMLLLSCVYMQYDVALCGVSPSFFHRKRNLFLLKAKRFRAAVPFSSPLSTVSRNWFATPTAAAATELHFFLLYLLLPAARVFQIGFTSRSLKASNDHFQCSSYMYPAVICIHKDPCNWKTTQWLNVPHYYYYDYQHWM